MGGCYGPRGCSMVHGIIWISADKILELVINLNYGV